MRITVELPQAWPPMAVKTAFRRLVLLGETGRRITDVTLCKDAKAYSFDLPAGRYRVQLWDMLDRGLVLNGTHAWLTVDPTTENTLVPLCESAAVKS